MSEPTATTAPTTAPAPLPTPEEIVRLRALWAQGLRENMDAARLFERTRDIAGRPLLHLLASLLDAADEAHRLRAENERLRDALRPFAKGSWVHSDWHRAKEAFDG
jgi:hypothetical protein